MNDLFKALTVAIFSIVNIVVSAVVGVIMLAIGFVASLVTILPIIILGAIFFLAILVLLF